MQHPLNPAGLLSGPDMEYKRSVIVVIEDSVDYKSLRHQQDSDQILDATLVIEKAAYAAYLNGIKINFPKKEFELLLLLATNSRKVFKRDEILQVIWGPNFRPKDSRSLDVHIRMIRKKLNGMFISTVRGVGYRLEK